MSRLCTAASSEYLEVGTSPITTYPLTIAVWFYPLEATVTYALASVGVGAGSARTQLLAAGAVGGDPFRAQSVDSGGSAANADTSAGFTANTWNHGVGVFASTTSRASYLNGGNAGSDATSVGIAGMNTITVGARRSAGALGSYFNGRLAEVAIWNVALSADEVLGLSKRICSPLDWRRSALRFYASLWGHGASEIDIIGGRVLTPSGTARADHPPVTPFWAKPISYFYFPSVGGGGGTFTKIVGSPFGLAGGRGLAG